MRGRGKVWNASWWLKLEELEAYREAIVEGVNRTYRK